jgi:hypothetical protein
MFTNDPFKDFKPSLNENISCGVVGELWTNSDWRCYVEGVCEKTYALIEQFTNGHAQTINIFGNPKVTFAPDHTFSWHANSGTYHQGALYRNGAVYRQVFPDGHSVLMLCIDEETAVNKGYPEEGWVRLKDVTKETEDAVNDTGSDVSGQRSDW